MTIPNHIVRAWKLEHGTMLAVHSTDQGILLFPRFFTSLINSRDEARLPQKFLENETNGIPERSRRAGR